MYIILNYIVFNYVRLNAGLEFLGFVKSKFKLYIDPLLGKQARSHKGSYPL